jgi:uncharacterized protein (UPF0332 family)
MHIVKTGLVDASFGRALNRGQTLRQLADYTGEPLVHEDIVSMIDSASEFVKRIEQLISTADF